MSLVHGGDIYSAQEELQCNIIDFSANINPMGLQDIVKNAICKSVECCEHYPDPKNRKLRSIIAQYETIDPEQVICGNGAADLIFRLAYAFKPQKALLLAPTFAEYELAMNNVGTDIEYHQLTVENQFHIDETILESIHQELSIMFLCNPNNPTGLLTDRDLLVRIAEKCKQLDIILVIDECFLDFIDHPEKYTMLGMLDRFPNLVVLKAFTKIFAMPGIRLGYAISSNNEYLDCMEQSAQPWSVSVTAEYAGVAALSDLDYINKSKRLVKDERSYLIKQLRKLKLQVLDSQANYIFFRINKKIDLKKKLYQKGILIRSCSNYHGLDEHYYRIAVRKHHENEILVQALMEVL